MSSANVAASSSRSAEDDGRRSRDMLQFLDLEAEVDYDDEGDDDDDSIALAGFIADDDDQEYGSRFSHQAFHSRMQQEDAMANDAREGPTPGRARTNPIQPENNDLQIGPTPSLWLVRCHAGKEFDVIHYAIMHATTTQTYAISSLHYRKDGEGYLYLETADPLTASGILEKCAFVRHSLHSSYGSVDMKRLDDQNETIRSLRFAPEPIECGTWVRLNNPTFGRPKPRPKPKPSKLIDPHDYVPPPEPVQKRSYYHNALALVLDTSASTDGNLSVLVVPRVDETLTDLGFSIPPEFKLGSQIAFSPEFLKEFETLSPKMESKGIRVDSGLRLATVERKAVVRDSDAQSWRDLTLFAKSGHPSVLQSFPRVREWQFEEGEQAISWDGEVEGKIHSVKESGVELLVRRRGNYLVSGEIAPVGWAVLKKWKIGTCVQHQSGKEGFVIGGKRDLVYFWKGQSAESCVPCAAHRNSLRKADPSSFEAVLVKRRESMTQEGLRLSNMSPDYINRALAKMSQEQGYNPHLLTPEQVDASLEATRVFQSPWKYWNVIVFKGIHRGTYHVMDVLTSQETKSGLKLVVRTDIINSTQAPMAIDYDYVVDAELLLPLHLIKLPQPTMAPPPDYVHPGLEALQKHRSALGAQRMLTPTPPPERTRGATLTPEGPVDTEENSVWNPEAPEPLATPRPLPSVGDLNHSSQHEFYELQSRDANHVKFQVKLDGTIAEFRNRKYTPSPKSSWLSIFFRDVNGIRRLAIDWNNIKGLIPHDMGEFKGMVVKKVAGVGTTMHVVPVNALTGKVPDNSQPFAVNSQEFCVVRLKEDAQKELQMWKYKPQPPSPSS
ncbi:hypothetical protein V5O48_016939 [Marasmius crinis-equi]|uniref:NGN domain-containing protein n=1 Tax=Marasmius crinis-equi TaxID=585013 RepID=A0ABR3EQC8_9AGAR